MIPSAFSVIKVFYHEVEPHGLNILKSYRLHTA